MEKKSYIYPGTVFTAQNYDPFTKKILVHPFVCVYNQALDPNLNGETNIIALLITSNSKQIIRQIPILKSKNNFLDKDSYCYSNNIYMFLKDDATVIGQLDSDTFFAIVQKRQLMLRGENDQCVQSLMNMKAYESKSSKNSKEAKDDTILNKKSEEKVIEKHLIIPARNASNKPEVKQTQKPVEKSNVKSTSSTSPSPSVNNPKRSRNKKKQKFIAAKPLPNLTPIIDVEKMQINQTNKIAQSNPVNQSNQTNKSNPINQTKQINQTYQKAQPKVQNNNFRNNHSKPQKKNDNGPVIIGEPHHQNFVNQDVQPPKKKKGFFKSRKYNNNERDKDQKNVDRGYIDGIDL